MVIPVISEEGTRDFTVRDETKRTRGSTHGVRVSGNISLISSSYLIVTVRNLSLISELSCIWYGFIYPLYCSDPDTGALLKLSQVRERQTELHQLKLEETQRERESVMMKQQLDREIESRYGKREREGEEREGSY